jgi:hypothetical protein
MGDIGACAPMGIKHLLCSSVPLTQRLRSSLQAKRKFSWEMIKQEILALHC